MKTTAEMKALPDIYCGSGSEDNRSSKCLCSVGKIRSLSQRQRNSILKKQTFIFLLFFTVILYQLKTVSSLSPRNNPWAKRRRSSIWNSSSKWKSLMNNYDEYHNDDGGGGDGDDEDEDLQNNEENFIPRNIISKHKSHYQTCFAAGEYLKGYTLEGGVKAGNFTNLGIVHSLNECGNLCCLEKRCMRALVLTSPSSQRQNCFQVDCFDFTSEKCKPSSDRRSNYNPSLFIRGIVAEKNKKEATSEENKHSIITENTMSDKDFPSLQRYKRGKAVCHKFTGNVCSDHVDQTKQYYFTSANTTGLDKKLARSFSLLHKRLTGKCRTIALQAICYRFYPQCSAGASPKPINVCENECDIILSGDCADEFQESGMLRYLKHIIPNCSNSDEEDEEDYEEKECIKLQYRLPTAPPSSSLPPTAATPITATVATSLYTTEKKPSLTLVNVTKDSEINLAETSEKSKTKLSTTAATLNKSISTSAIPKTATLENLTVSHPTQITVTTVTTKGDTQIVTTTVATKGDKTTQPDGIRVSAGDNALLTLPEDKISLYASTWPKEPTKGDYSYLWTQISFPASSHGYMEGKNTESVKLSNLGLPGVYTFKLEVKSKAGKYGVGFVNITVKENRVNHPPRAEIYPENQDITLPINTVILDGSKSTDDDKIVSYKWEELGSPIKEKTVFTSTDKKLLELKNLVAGVYKYKLTVTDSDGETDSTESEVTVNNENDYPPEANAGNDFIIRLPNNSVVLNGTKSKDDKGILTYEWKKTAESPPCDIIGTDKPILRVSRMLVGTYLFVLKVIDSKEQSNEAQVKVVVLPEENTVPIAVAGDDKELVYPDASTTLDGSLSTDNSMIASYQWEKIGGPEKIKMVDANKVKVHIADLVPGTYVFKLTVTDDKTLTGTDTVKVHVKKDHNDPPVAVAGKDQVIFLPRRSAVVDGSMSHDDEFIQSYQWVRTGVSPAAGNVVNRSDAQPKLQLTDLVKGHYTFELTVTDNKRLIGTDAVVIYVKESPDSLNLVEMYLEVDINKFTEEDKKQLIRKISVIMEVAQEFVSVQEISDAGYTKGVRIVFLVNDPNFEGRKYDGKYISDTLKEKVGNGGKLFDLTMQRVEPYVCRNNCSGHGHCDESSKQCVCDAFWTADIFKTNFGERASNCDWSVLYLSVVVFGIFVFMIGICWTGCYCVARKKRNRRRARYRALRSTDPDGAEDEILLIPKGLKSMMTDKLRVASLTFSESEDDSDSTTVFDKKQRKRNGIHRMNGHANGKVPKYLDEEF